MGALGGWPRTRGRRIGRTSTHTLPRSSGVAPPRISARIGRSGSRSSIGVGVTPSFVEPVKSRRQHAACFGASRSSGGFNAGREFCCRFGRLSCRAGSRWWCSRRSRDKSPAWTRESTSSSTVYSAPLRAVSLARPAPARARACRVCPRPPFAGASSPCQAKG